MKIDLMRSFLRHPPYALAVEFDAWRRRRGLTPSARFRRMVAVHYCWFEFASEMMPAL